MHKQTTQQHDSNNTVAILARETWRIYPGVYFIKMNEEPCERHYSLLYQPGTPSSSGSSNMKTAYVIIQYNAIKYNAMQYNTIQYNTTQYNTMQYNIIPYDTIQYQYNTIQYNTIQYNTIQYNTIQYNTIKYAAAIVRWYHALGRRMGKIDFLLKQGTNHTAALRRNYVGVSGMQSE